MKSGAIGSRTAKLLTTAALITAVTLAGAACGTEPVASNVAPGPTASTPASPVKNAPSKKPLDPATLPAGTLFFNPVSGRKEVIDPAISKTAVLIGDSQAEGAAGVRAKDTWVQQGLTALGYRIAFAGAGGTGFYARSTKTPNYQLAIAQQRHILPYGTPALVVIQGGGNDATQGASDAQITSNANKLITQLRASYPKSQFVMIGTLARGSAFGGGRRTQVDSLLATVANKNMVPFISAGDWISRYKLNKLMADSVHLTPAAHHKLAGVLSQRVKALGIKGPTQ